MRDILKRSLRSLSFFRPLDAVLISAILAATLWGILTFRFTEGTRAVVYIANKKYAWYDLSGAKKKISLPTQIGPLILEIGENSARILSSPCPNKLCVKTGLIRHSHEEIVCLPGKLLLVLEGPANESDGKGELDAITY